MCSEVTRRVLLLKPCCIGDVLLASPLVAAIQELWPGAEVVWAADRHSAEAAAGVPGVGRVLDATGAVPGALRPLAAARLAWRCRRIGFDAALVPDRSRVLAALAAAAGIPVRIGLDSAGRGRLHTLRVRVDPHEVRHEADLYMGLAVAAGAAPRPPKPSFRPTPGARRRAKELLGRLALPGPLLAVHPGGGVNPGMTLTEKRWPPERFAAVVKRWLAEAGVAGGGRRGDGLPGRGAVILGARTDADAADEVVSAVGGPMSPRGGPRLLDLCGTLSLDETAAVIERCAVYLGNDTGMTHLACAVGTPVVAIFGPTDPRRYGPLPDCGVAVAPTGAQVAQGGLAAARGSAAVRGVSIEAVWSALLSVAKEDA